MNQNTSKWFKLACESNQLQLSGTLNGGQSFRWTKVDDNGVIKWTGVFANHVWILKQLDNYLAYQVYGSENSEDFYNHLLTDYFQLNLDLNQSFNEWSSKDAIFKEAASKFYGIRILRQDTVENIFSFICSSNNNISRITSMVGKLARLYGNKICMVDNQVYYSFPTIEALTSDNVEKVLKSEGFGYRAKYISESAKYIFSNGGNDWIHDLKALKYAPAKQKLMSLTGVGPKVADCICLMSLNHLDAIPVDTHVYQIAKKFYMPKLPKHKTVTTKVYNEIGDHFRQLYGPLAGWAHTVLFCADLKKFQNDVTK